MKLYLFLAFFLTGMLLFTGCHIDGIVAKGDIVTELRDIQDFHAVDASTFGEVELRIDTAFYVEVQAQENIIDHLETINDNGVMRMTPQPEGFVLPASSLVELKRGGKHVMFMNLNRDLKPGDQFVLTLTFEKIGQVQVPVTVMENQ